MARQWFAHGIQVYETGEEEYFVRGMQLCNDQADGAATLDAAAGSVSVTGAAATFVHVTADYPFQFYGRREMTPLLQM